ncbi:phosphatase PAP2 family protein [Aquabacterium sp.]|uniref:phosphatase PAP2 family protein n=1 Tax=Aquabacterium sp. TaxID=1872578 RepID=UPI0035B079AB
MTPLRGWRRVWPLFWLKAVGTSAFMTLFFTAYIHLLKNPRGEVITMPLTRLDAWIPFQWWAVLIYLSLWFYVSMPVALMVRWRDVASYGWRIALLCLVGLACFWLWPTAVPPSNIDWAVYPGLSVLKGVDTAGNACPSLHVATAVFSACWLRWMAPYVGVGRRWRVATALWCVGIAYSTVAIRQHVVLDVCSGALLGAGMARLLRPSALLRA